MILFIVLNFILNFTVVPSTALFVSTIVAFIMAGIFSSHESKIVDRELGDDDKGLQQIKREKEEPSNNIALKKKQEQQLKKSMKEKSYFWIPLIISGLILGAEFTVGLVSDMWFYGGAMAVMAYTVWCVIRIVSRYNRLTTRKLPQFNRKGGDDSAKV